MKVTVSKIVGIDGSPQLDIIFDDHKDPWYRQRIIVKENRLIITQKNALKKWDGIDGSNSHP